MTFTLEEASAQLSQLIDKAASGEEVYISRGGMPAIRLMPVAAEKTSEESLTPRVPGLGKGQVWMASDFDGPMPDDWLDEFYNGAIFDRILIAQCQWEKMPILTRDPLMQQYAVETLW